MLRIKKAGHSGILLPDLDIGLDYSGKKASFVFVSHAHADHIPRTKGLNAYATPPTAALMKLRGYDTPVHPLPFFKPFETEKARVTLYPAGHILGSAMTFIESDLGNVLYTGDYRIPPSPATEGFQLPDKQIDYFITEATFALPIYKWKPYEKLSSEIRSFASEALIDGYTPIFLAYNLGKAQELMYILKELAHPMQIHNAGYPLCGVYENEGFELGDYESLNEETCEGKIIITPSAALGNNGISNIKKKRIAYCSGWAVMEARQVQLTVDKLIPISDHLDFFELIDLCDRIRPQKVLITHTPNPKIVQHYLTNLGIESSFLDIEKDELD